MAKNTPKWREADYTPFFLLHEPIHTPSEIRKEYSRMRDILMKRAKRLEQAGLYAQAEYLRGIMPKLNTIAPETVALRLSTGHATYKEAAYSLEGIKKIQRYFYDEGAEINELPEVLNFADYMASWRMSAFSKAVVSSEQAVEMFKTEYEDIGGSFATFYTIYKGRA